MKSLKNWTMYMSLGTLVFLLASCEEHCRCHHDKSASYASCLIQADWSQYTVDDDLNGMTVHCFNSDAGNAVSLATHNTEEARLNLPIGTYDVAVFSNTPDEYSFVEFDGMDRFDTAELNAVNLEQESWYDEDRLIMAPEWMGVDYIHGFEVTQDMALATAGTNCKCIDCECCATHAPSEGFLIGKVTPLNVIWTLKVKVHIEGIHNLRSARGAISGLADGYKFSLEFAKETTAAQLLSNWELTLDENDPTIGEIEVSVLTFGLPYGHGGRFDANPFSIQLLLVDDETVCSKNFQVVDGIEVDEETQTISIYIDYGEPLPNVDPNYGDGAFKAEVDDWGDGGDVNVDM